MLEDTNSSKAIHLLFLILIGNKVLVSKTIKTLIGKNNEMPEAMS